MLRPPRPLPRTVTVVSPPDSSTAGSGPPGRRRGTRRRAAGGRSPACTSATSRASPSIAVAEHDRRDARRSAAAAAALRAPAAGSRSARSGHRCEQRVAGLWRLVRRRRRGGATTAGGSSMRYFASTARASAKVVGSGTVGPEAITAGSSPGTSEIAKVTTRAGAAAAASRPPLIAERCLRTRVDLADRRAAAQQRARHRLLVGERQPRRRQRQQRRAAARDQKHQLIVGPEALRQIEDAPRRALAGGVGHRVARLDDLDPLAGHAMAVARHDDALRAAPATVPRRRAPSPPRPCRRRPPTCGPLPPAEYARRSPARVGRGQGGGEQGFEEIARRRLIARAPRHSSVLPSPMPFHIEREERPALDRRPPPVRPRAQSSAWLRKRYA